jgi:hypothetical protein
VPQIFVQRAYLHNCCLTPSGAKDRVFHSIRGHPVFAHGGGVAGRVYSGVEEPRDRFSDYAH